MKTYSLGITILLIVGLCIGWIGYKHLHSQLDKSNEQAAEMSMKADLQLGRANTYFSNMNDYKKKLDQHIQEDIKTRQATVTSYSEVQATYKTHSGGTLTIPGPIVLSDPAKPDDTNKVVTKGPELISVPFVFQDYRLLAKGDAAKKTFDYWLTQTFEIILAESKLHNGSVNNYAELYELNDKGERVGRMELTKFEVHKAPLDPKAFHLWDPAIDILAGGVLFRGWDTSFNGSIGMSIASYGRDRNLDWRFIRLGLGIDKSGLEFSLAPVEYNFAQPLPIINNLWISPSIGVNMDIHTYFLGLGVSAML